MSPHDLGYKDFKAGQLDNPFPNNFTKSRQWEFGFSKAYFEKLREVEKREQKEEP